LDINIDGLKPSIEAITKKVSELRANIFLTLLNSMQCSRKMSTRSVFVAPLQRELSGHGSLVINLEKVLQRYTCIKKIYIPFQKELVLWNVCSGGVELFSYAAKSQSATIITEIICNLGKTFKRVNTTVNIRSHPLRNYYHGPINDQPRCKKAIFGTYHILLLTLFHIYGNVSSVNFFLGNIRDQRQKIIDDCDLIDLVDWTRIHLYILQIRFIGCVVDIVKPLLVKNIPDDSGEVVTLDVKAENINWDEFECKLKSSTDDNSVDKSSVGMEVAAASGSTDEVNFVNVDTAKNKLNDWEGNVKFSSGKNLVDKSFVDMYVAGANGFSMDIVTSHTRNKLAVCHHKMLIPEGCTLYVLSENCICNKSFFHPSNDVNFQNCNLFCRLVHKDINNISYKVAEVDKTNCVKDNGTDASECATIFNISISPNDLAGIERGHPIIGNLIDFGWVITCGYKLNSLSTKGALVHLIDDDHCNNDDEKRKRFIENTNNWNELGAICRGNIDNFTQSLFPEHTNYVMRMMRVRDVVHEVSVPQSFDEPSK